VRPGFQTPLLQNRHGDNSGSLDALGMTAKQNGDPNLSGSPF
jgi:hypothetical protein